MIEPALHALRRDESGVTVIEFALLAPTLLIMLFGLLDLAHNMYTAQMLQGAVQETARNSTIEGASSRTAVLDSRVRTAVLTIAPGATLNFQRKSYSSFTAVGRPEDYNDLNSNGTCDASEPYEDANGNGGWDQDVGKSGFGGARDSVLYTVTVSYKRFFPIYAFIPGQSDRQTMVAQTVLRNQPYSAQADGAAPTVGNCT